MALILVVKSTHVIRNKFSNVRIAHSYIIIQCDIFAASKQKEFVGQMTLAEMSNP